MNIYFLVIIFAIILFVLGLSYLIYWLLKKHPKPTPPGTYKYPWGDSLSNMLQNNTRVLNNDNNGFSSICPWYYVGSLGWETTVNEIVKNVTYNNQVCKYATPDSGAGTFLAGFAFTDTFDNDWHADCVCYQVHIPNSDLPDLIVQKTGSKPSNTGGGPKRIDLIVPAGGEMDFNCSAIEMPLEEELVAKGQTPKKPTKLSATYACLEQMANWPVQNKREWGDTVICGGKQVTTLDQNNEQLNCNAAGKSNSGNNACPNFVKDTKCSWENTGDPNNKDCFGKGDVTKNCNILFNNNESMAYACKNSAKFWLNPQKIWVRPIKCPKEFSDYTGCAPNTALSQLLPAFKNGKIINSWAEDQTSPFGDPKNGWIQEEILLWTDSGSSAVEASSGSFWSNPDSRDSNYPQVLTCVAQPNPKIGYYSPLGTRYQNWEDAKIVDSSGKNMLPKIDENIQNIVTETGRQPILYSNIKGIDMPSDQRCYF